MPRFALIGDSKAVEDAIGIVGGMESIDTVVIATATRALFNLGVHDSIERLPESNNLEPALEGLDAAVRRIVAAGKRVVLLEIERRHPGNVSVFDATGILCDEASGTCSPTKGERLLYGVTDHISDYAATLVGRALNEFLASHRPDAGTSGVSP